MLPTGMTPVAGTATAQGPAAEAAQPVSPRNRAPGPNHFDLAGLPSGLRDEVTRRMAPRDVLRLAAASRQDREDHADAARAARQVLEAQVASPETIGRLLNGPGGIAELPPIFQAAPRKAVIQRLNDLAMQVGALPEPDRPARFSAVLDRTQTLGAEGGTTLTYLAVHVAGLPEGARHGAFCGLANRLKLLPVDHASRTIASLTLSRSIPHLPEENRDEATRKIVEVLRPLPRVQRKFVLARPDDQLSPAIKQALRQPVAEEGRISLTRAGTSAHA